MEPLDSRFSFSPGPSSSSSSFQGSTNLSNHSQPASNEQAQTILTQQNPRGRGIFEFLEARGLGRRQEYSQQDPFFGPQIPSMDHFPSPGSLPEGISRQIVPDIDLRIKQKRRASIKRQELLDPRLRPRNPDALVVENFDRFENLPSELRIMIWKLALPGPRILDIRLFPLKKTQTELDREKGNKSNPVRWSEWVNEDGTGDEYLDKGYHRPDGKPPLVGVKSQCMIPSLLLVNREANEVAAKCYEREFSSYASVPETYFDYKVDTLYVQYSNFNRSVCTTKSQRGETLLDSIKNLRTESLEKVTRLALRPDPGSIRHTGQLLEIEVAELLLIFKGVTALTIVADHHDSSSIWHTDRSPISFIEPIDIHNTFYSYCFSTFTNELNPSHMRPTRVSACLPPVIFSTNSLHAALRMQSGEESENSSDERFPSVHVMISITAAIWKSPKLVLGEKYIDVKHTYIDVKHAIPIKLGDLALDLSRNGPLTFRKIAGDGPQNFNDAVWPQSSAHVEMNWAAYLEISSLKLFEYTERMRKKGKVWWDELIIEDSQVSG